MSKLLTSIIACAMSIPTSSAATIQLEQAGWSRGATLTVAFSGQDANGDGAILQSELTAFSATWTLPPDEFTNWTLPDVQPDGFVFTDLNNYLFFTRNAAFSLVSAAFEGEALASVFDASLFPVDSTVSPATVVPEPAGVAVPVLVGFALWRRRRAGSMAASESRKVRP